MSNQGTDPFAFAFRQSRACVSIDVAEPAAQTKPWLQNTAGRHTMGGRICMATTCQHFTALYPLRCSPDAYAIAMDTLGIVAKQASSCWAVQAEVCIVERS